MKIESSLSSIRIYMQSRSIDSREIDHIMNAAYLRVFFLLFSSLILLTNIVTIQSERAAGSQDTTISPAGIRGVNLLDPILIHTAVGSPYYYMGNSPPIEDSLFLIKSYGFNFVRIPYYWESYQFDPQRFLEQVEFIAMTAEKLGIFVDWDFHQLGASSYFHFFNSSSYGGFPHHLLSKYKFDGGEREEQEFWTDLWNRTLSYRGKDAWQLQAEFMVKIVNAVDKYSSTFGYEILNSPSIYDSSQYVKIGKYHEYIGKELRKHTSKPIFMNLACGKSCIDTPLKDIRLMLPSNVNNIIFAPHFYDDPDEKTSLFLRELASNLDYTPIVIGEWAKKDPKDMKEYISLFDSIDAGWVFWAWNYQSTGEFGVPLTNETYSPTEELISLLDATKSVMGNDT
jgi:Cellulase (glycosyl hydrolase family 5)